MENIFYGGEPMNISYKASDFYNKKSSNGNSYVTSVSSLSSTAQANLSLNNILSILLISIGILIIILAIAILIKIK